jgi:hypothetical protein
MNWEPNEHEIKSVCALDLAGRFEYFVKKVADNELLWGLGADDLWVMKGGPDGVEVMPLWPHARYAEMCATDQWAGNAPHEITLDEWLEKWTPGLTRDGLKVGVFPVPGSGGVIMHASALKVHIDEELEKYE